MRISLQASSLSSSPYPALDNPRLTVSIRPANNLSGNFDFQMNSNALLRLLRQRTDLSEVALETFQGDLKFAAKSRIPAVTFTDELLREIGYFID